MSGDHNAHQVDQCSHIWRYIGSKRQSVWQCPHCESYRFLDPPRAAENSALTKQKAKWYQEGVEAERAACVKLLEEGAGLPDLSAHSKFDMYVKIFMQRVADQIKERGA